MKALIIVTRRTIKLRLFQLEWQKLFPHGLMTGNYIVIK